MLSVFVWDLPLQSVEEFHSTVISTLQCLACIIPKLLSVLLVGSLGWLHWRYWRVLRFARTLPTGARPLPLLGHIYHPLLYGYTGTINTLVKESKASVLKGLKCITIWLGPYPIISVMNAKDIQTILTSSKTSEKSDDYELVKCVLGNGLLTAPGHIHKVTRRFLNPFFTPGSVNQLIPLMNQAGRIVVGDLSEHVGRGQFHIARPMARAFYNSLCNIIFGSHVEIEANSLEFKSLSKTLRSVGSILLNRLFKVWLWSDAVFNILWRNEVLTLNKEWRNFADKYSKIYFQTNMEFNFNKDKKDSNSSTVSYCLEDSNATFRTGLTLANTRSLLDCCADMLMSQPQFTRRDLYNEMLTLMLAGTDSTRISISSCLLALAAKPDIQEQVYQEIVSVVGLNNNDVSVGDIHRMVFLDQVLKETLRYFNVLPFVMRKVSGDIQLSFGLVPAGSTLMVNLLALHFDPTVYPDPHTFDPNRFSPENASRIGKYAYLPFSAGARVCIGNVYAVMLIKMMLIHVLRKYRLTTLVDISTLRFSLSLLMYSADGYHVSLEHRLGPKKLTN